MRIGFFIGALLLGLGACADAGQRADNLAAAQAASAHIQVRRTAIDQHANALNVGSVHTTGLVFSMADAIAVHQTLVADFTVLAHFLHLPVGDCLTSRGRAAGKPLMTA